MLGLEALIRRRIGACADRGVVQSLDARYAYVPPAAMARTDPMTLGLSFARPQLHR